MPQEGGAYRVEQSVARAGDLSAKVRFFVRKGKGAAVPIGMSVSCFGTKKGAKP
ncbi:MAG: hypothetical protein K2W96_25445 [Gemmataceae bacterium]|nr:hypothetical protein [Gemmataceae bacterium]